MLDRAIVAGFARHVMTVAGGGLVSAGVLTEADLEVAVGALIALAGVVWSVLDKRKRA